MSTNVISKDISLISEKVQTIEKNNININNSKVLFAYRGEPKILVKQS